MKPNNKSQTDTIYLSEEGPNPFKFDSTVARVFDDMLQRSVPHYEQNIQTIVDIANQYAKPNSLCFDLGCSLAKVSIGLSQSVLPVEKIIAIDNSPQMVSAAKLNVSNHKLITPIQILHGDLSEANFQQSIKNASVVILNYTLQFLKPQDRLLLLQKIHASLIKDGVLILSEKIRAKHPVEQDFLDQQYALFKKQKGYHKLEISRKREALENVLIPDTVSQHQQRLREAGFSAMQIWHQRFHFISWIVWR